MASPPRRMLFTVGLLLLSFSQLVTTETWAILVDTSRYFYNYRHSVNVLAMNDELRKLGVAEENIILLLADYPALNSRNRFPGRMYYHKSRDMSVSSPDVEVDSTFVSTGSFLDLLTGHQNQPLLKSNSESTVIIYMTGHGGDEFMKFNDIDELGSFEFGAAIEEMYLKNMYKNMLIMIDTCQAATLTQHITAPNVVSITSSRLGENSYALHSDTTIGISTIDRFTAATVKFLSSYHDNRMIKSQHRRRKKSTSVLDLFQTFNVQELRSHAVLHISNLSQPISEWKLDEIFPLNSQVIRDVGYFDYNKLDAAIILNEASKSNTRKQPRTSVQYLSVADWSVSDTYSIDNAFDLSPLKSNRKKGGYLIMGVLSVLTLVLPCCLI